jgi:hypothetical protein
MIFVFFELMRVYMESGKEDEIKIKEKESNA